MSTSRDDKYLQNLGPEATILKQTALDDAAEQWAMNVWAKDDSRSLIRLAPECVKKAMLELSEEFQQMTEEEVRAAYKKTYKQFLSATDNQLRISFWLEYERCQAEMLPQMAIRNILRGIMPYDSFQGRFLKNHLRVAFLTIPPKSYTVRLNEMLDVGLDRIRDVLDIPSITTNSKGQQVVNTKLLELQFKITNYIDMRKNGAIAQKLQIEQKSLNMNMKGDAKDIMNAIEHNNMADLDRRLVELRKKQLMVEKGVHPDKADVSTEAIIVSDEGSKDGRKPESEEPS